MEPQNNLNEDKNNLKKLLPFIILIVLIFTFSTVLLFSKSKSVQQPVVTDIQLDEISEPVNGNSEIIQDYSDLVGIMKLTAKDGQNYSIGDNVFIIVTADSFSEPITAYDAVITYNKNDLDYIGTENLSDQYELHSVDRENGLMITGYQPLDNKDLIVLNNTALVQINFRAKKTGVISLNISAVPGETNDSNLVNNQTKDILGSVENVIIQVE